MKNLFDQYIAVDWSARNSPSPARPSHDSIWIAIKNSLNGVGEEKYFRTRNEAANYLHQFLLDSVKNNLRTLVGYDFDFGFPAGFGKALSIPKEDLTWLAIWKLIADLVEDNDDNSNNRFEVASHLNSLCSPNAEGGKPGPFWGLPRNTQFPFLTAKKELKYPFETRNNAVLREKRWTEMLETRAQPVWKLIGSASVGGQTLMGIPTLYKLRFSPELADFSTIWPFEKGFMQNSTAIGTPTICHVEIWPGIFSKELINSSLIKDQAQVRKTVDWFNSLDSSGKLFDLMNSSEGLNEQQITDCVNEEGWVIGMGKGTGN